jgi:hypothetical protein
MAEVTRYDHGTLSWAELATTDPAAAKKFYSGLFGWSFVDSPMGPGPEDIYTRAQIGGKDVGALYPMRPEQRRQGIPSNWLAYVTVTSADEAAGRARSLGGTVIAEPFDVMTLGRMAMLQDPAGAMFAVWQAMDHIGAQRSGEPGTFCWMELLTRDTAKAAKFYAELFGWNPKAATFDSSYTEFCRGEVPAGGMMAISKEMGDIPPNWGIYWQVADTDAAAAKAKALGATIRIGPQDIPSVGRFAVIQDPQGAMFSIVRLIAS